MAWQVFEPSEGKKLASIAIPASAGDACPLDRHEFAKGCVIIDRGGGKHSLIVGSSMGVLHAIDADKYDTLPSPAHHPALILCAPLSIP